MLVHKMLIKIIKPFARFNTKFYMKVLTSSFRKLGVNIPIYNGIGYIDPTCYVDSSEYSLITIGENVTISRNVTLLTHDFSIGKGLKAINNVRDGQRYKFIKPIEIGDDSFIGANAFILPGTKIGKFCIIGSGAVVKGLIPDYSVCVGNPAKVVADTRVWAEKHYKCNDYVVIESIKK